MSEQGHDRPELVPQAIARLQLVSIGATLEGASVAGIETWMRIPEWSLAFDVGRAAQAVVRCKTLAITHAHMDHAGGLPAYLSMRRMFHLPPATVLAPAETCEELRQIVHIWEGLHGRAFEWTLVPMRPGDEHDIGGGRRLRAFASDHVVPTRGYAVIAEVRRLRPQLTQHSHAEIAELASLGAEVTDLQERVLFALTGDTRPTVIATVPELQQAEVFLHETTFIDDLRKPEDAWAKGHTHLASLVAQLPMTRGTFVPYHISQIYTARQVHRRIVGSLPRDLAARTLPFVPGGYTP